MDYEAIDVVGPRRRRARVALPTREVASTVWVPRDAYLRDIRGAFRGRASIQRQAETDAPRMRLTVDGRRLTHAPALPEALVAVCTQACMGLPLELLCGAPGVACVREPPAPSPLSVTMCSSGDFVVRKDLRVDLGDGTTAPVRALVVGMASAAVVVISFVAAHRGS